MVITRNNPLPVFIASNEEICAFDDECNPIGIYRDTRPLISEMPLEPGLTVVLFTDGLVHAGSRSGETLDVKTFLEAHTEEETTEPQVIADRLLADAIQLDRGRPVDDISVVVIQVTSQHEDSVRRMTVELPLS
jgi:serine phosphatase RsbU (regulator of sigma subunit)